MDDSGNNLDDNLGAPTNKQVRLLRRESRSGVEKEKLPSMSNDDENGKFEALSQFYLHK